MQAAVAEIDLPDGPVVALIEDATGAGETGAALILASRMMAAGKSAAAVPPRRGGTQLKLSPEPPGVPHNER